MHSAESVLRRVKGLYNLIPAYISCPAARWPHLPSPPVHGQSVENSAFRPQPVTAASPANDGAARLGTSPCRRTAALVHRRAGQGFPQDCVCAQAILRATHWRRSRLRARLRPAESRAARGRPTGSPDIQERGRTQSAGGGQAFPRTLREAVGTDAAAHGAAHELARKPLAHNGKIQPVHAAADQGHAATKNSLDLAAHELSLQAAGCMDCRLANAHTGPAAVAPRTGAAAQRVQFQRHPAIVAMPAGRSSPAPALPADCGCSGRGPQRRCPACAAGRVPAQDPDGCAARPAARQSMRSGIPPVQRGTGGSRPTFDWRRRSA